MYNFMKSYLLIPLVVALFLTLIGCGSSKVPVTNAPSGEIEISIPCSGQEYFTTKKYFRANANGESLDQMIAKKKALANARAQLASDINSLVKAVTDNYVKSAEFNNKEEALERFEQNSRTVVRENLRGVRQICEKAVRVKATGKYKYYVAIELSADDLVSAYNERLSKDQSLKIDYNYEKFKETFNSEMDKLDQQQGR